MTQRERRRAAMRHAFRYQEYRAAVSAYVDSIISSHGGKQQFGGTPVSGGHRSDPTAQAAIKLAEMPEPLRTKALWVRAVNDAWKECAAEDDDLAYLFEKNFRLTGDILGPEHNTDVRERIVEDLGIAIPTFYKWLENVCDILVYYAAKRKLL